MVIITDVLDTSSSTVDRKYDVFLSFRGFDTRNNFTNHLHTALVNAHINTFLDDTEIETGLCLKPELESAIKASRASVIVLSKNYASSTWCLNELVLILEQHTNFNQIVIPIFHHVEPSDVRNQKGSFGDAMEDHRKKMEAETNTERKSEWAEKIDIWERALKQVSNLKGKESKNRLETEFIEEIVANINRQLGVHLRRSLPQDPLIGLDDSIEFLGSWLKDGSKHTADILTILGMGGIGKSSLAKHVYNLHCHEFTRSSFIENISRRCVEKSNGLLDVQKQLCDDISKASSIPIQDVSVYTSTIENTLARKKVFLVLDDIDGFDQLNALLGKKGFHQGSKIIITTKDASLTERCALFNPQVHPKHTKHMLEGLNETESLKLLCLQAFKCEDPKQGYKEVSDSIVKYCQGHPLALKVVGSSLHNRDVAYWEEWLERLNEETDSRINSVLRMSFDSLPWKMDKELFKHIACFFVGMDRDITETILTACGIMARSGITNLMDRCLLSFGRNNKLMMHQLVQEMGRDAARHESPRSRLWCHEESFDVLKQKTGKENILGLALDMRMLEDEKFNRSLFELEPDALSKMDNLKLLQLNYVKDFLWLKKFPRKLRWLCMHGFPLKSIPSDLPMNNLVSLDLSYSNFKSFDMSCSGPQRPEKRKKLLQSVKTLDLSYCYDLSSLGGFRELPSLESLFLRNCTSLIEVCESIEHCDELVFLDLSNCKKLRKLPTILGKLKNVSKLVLDGCNLGEHPPEMTDITSQTSSSAILEVIWKSLAFQSSLVRLSLGYNNLSNESFPTDLSGLSMLKYLNLDGNPIVSMPNCVRSLPRLESLRMDDCKLLMSIEHPPRTLTELSFTGIGHSLESLVRKVAFDPEMSPLHLFPFAVSTESSFEIEGMIKIQPMEGVDETILSSLGWSNLDFFKRSHVVEESQTQILYYEFGIFSTIYGGKVMPSWIHDRSKGPLISFTIPSSPRNIRGLNFCYVQTSNYQLQYIRIRNDTKNRTWIYRHYKSIVNVGEEYLTFVSHWMFGKNDMEDGDLIIIFVLCGCADNNDDVIIRECGVSIVYEDEEDGKKEKEDPLTYYKSWNHIIGGDLSIFQLTTGEYILEYFLFDSSPYVSFNFKEKNRRFQAFSQKKSNIHGHAIEDITEETFSLDNLDAFLRLKHLHQAREHHIIVKQYSAFLRINDENGAKNKAGEEEEEDYESEDELFSVTRQ